MRVKKEKKIQELTTMLTLNDPCEHSEVLRISGQHYVFKSLNQSGHVMIQYNKKSQISHDTALYIQSEISAT